LRTEHKRLSNQISLKTKEIDQAFDVSLGVQQTSPTIHSFTVQNLKRNLDASRNALRALTAEVEGFGKDDRISLAEELEEAVKLLYCEHIRLSSELQDQSAEFGEREMRCADARFSTSKRHLRDLRQAVQLHQEENAALREKSIAYAVKAERMRIEEDLRIIQEDSTKTQEIIDKSNAEKEENIRNLEDLSKTLKEDDEVHQMKVDELTAILESMKEKLRAKLESVKKCSK
jgi:hypothetical protein